MKWYCFPCLQRCVREALSDKGQWMKMHHSTDCRSEYKRVIATRDWDVTGYSCCGHWCPVLCQ